MNRSILVLALMSLLVSCKVPESKAWVVSTLAGSRSTAQFYYPCDVAVDSEGNVYVTDTLNNRIQKITTNGVVSTLAGSTEGFADGTGDAAQFYLPFGVAVDSSGNVHVADRENNRIRKIEYKVP